MNCEGDGAVSRKEYLIKIILRISAILLPISLVCFIVAFTFGMLGIFDFPRFSISVFSLFCGIILWYAGILLRDRFRFFFTATLLSLSGLMLLLIDFRVIELTLRGIWPFFMLFIGISFMIAGSLRFHRLHAVYIVPALAFAALGFVFLLFSTSLIPFSLKSLVLWWFPLLILPSIISFFIWLSQKRHHNHDGND